MYTGRFVNHSASSASSAAPILSPAQQAKMTTQAVEEWKEKALLSVAACARAHSKAVENLRNAKSPAAEEVAVSAVLQRGAELDRAIHIARNYEITNEELAAVEHLCESYRNELSERRCL